MAKREFPNSKNPFTRFQIGVDEVRKMQVPVYKKGVIVGHRKTDENVSVFKLLGWGETLEAAEKMALSA